MTKRLAKISKYTPSLFQGKLDFRPAQSLSFSAEHPAERMTLRILSAALIALVCAYLYFVSASVFSVMARKAALARISVIGRSIGGLEQQYFALSQAIKPDVGASLGLQPISRTHYVYRPGNVGAATIGNDEI